MGLIGGLWVASYGGLDGRVLYIYLREYTRIVCKSAWAPSVSYMVSLSLRVVFSRA